MIALMPRVARRILLSAFVVIGLLVWPARVATTQEARQAALMDAYELGYNLDYAEAVNTLEAVITQHPSHPAAYRGIATLTWLRMLFLRGAVLVDAQMTATLNAKGDIQKPPDDLVGLFESHVERAVKLSEAMVKANPDDPEAHYQLGMSVALVASYQASVDGEGLKALRVAKRAYKSHERVLELDPTRNDSKLTLGMYRYLVSLLPRPFRMMAYLVGFDGGREAAIRMIEEAAVYPGETAAEAKFALVLVYNRERKFEKAQRVLSDLKRNYPRNRLVWLESAATWLRDDRAYLAQRELVRGFAKLALDDRTRMAGEEQMWLLNRGTASVSLGNTAAAFTDLEAARDGVSQGWVQGRASVELGKIADLEGNRSLARDEYNRGRKLCRESNDRRCVRAAEELREHRYTAN
jgi:tetratricopeptide (TPR) repeat protein